MIRTRKVKIAEFISMCIFVIVVLAINASCDSGNDDLTSAQTSIVGRWKLYNQDEIDMSGSGSYMIFMNNGTVVYTHRNSDGNSISEESHYTLSGWYNISNSLRGDIEITDAIFRGCGIFSSSLKNDTLMMAPKGWKCLKDCNSYFVRTID